MTNAMHFNGNNFKIMPSHCNQIIVRDKRLLMGQSLKTKKKRNTVTVYSTYFHSQIARA